MALDQSLYDMLCQVAERIKDENPGPLFRLVQKASEPSMVHDYQSGDPVKVYGSAFNASVDQGGLDAFIVRQMPEATDFEVQYSGEVPEGTAIIVPPEQLRKVAV